MALSKVIPTGAAVAVNVLLLALAVVGCITVDAMRDEIIRQDGALKKNVGNMRELQSLSAALVGQCGDEALKSMMQKLADEFRYSDPVIDESNLVIIISQSGETADTLAALRESKRLGAHTLAVVNVVGSAIAKLADQVIYTWAGPEIAVATTKAFSTQLAVIYLLTAHMARELGTITEEAYAELVAALEQLPDAVERVLTEENLRKCQYFASRYYGNHDAFYIGRNMDSAVCLEGSLKLKEIAYLHSEAYPAGELKHGPISLIEDGTLVVALATIEPLFDKTIANVREVNARGADVLCITLEGLEEKTRKVTESFITIPKVHPMLQPSLSLIPLQVFAYYMAVNRGCDVDKPRNLAKSVTVE
jgi:glucosamine--fructose-6-phosphate aminotransferase (isomerizing)